MRTRMSVRDTLLRRMHVDLPSRLHSRWDDIELSISLVIGNAKRAAVNAVAASLCRGDLDTATLHRYAQEKGRGLIRLPVPRNCRLSYRFRHAVKHAQTRHIIPAHACKLRRRERIIVEGSKGVRRATSGVNAIVEVSARDGCLGRQDISEHTRVGVEEGIGKAMRGSSFLV